MLIHRGASTEVRDEDGRLPMDAASGDATAALRRGFRIERGPLCTALHPRPARESGDARGHLRNPAGAYQSVLFPVAHFDFEKVKQLQKLARRWMMTRATWDELGIEAAAHMGLAPMAQFLADLWGAGLLLAPLRCWGAGDLVKRMVQEDQGCLRERGAHDIALLAYQAFAG